MMIGGMGGRSRDGVLMRQVLEIILINILSQLELIGFRLTCFKLTIKLVYVSHLDFFSMAIWVDVINTFKIKDL